MTATGTPAAEVAIDEALVRALLACQAPHLADRELRHVASGWDNETWRLGSDLAVRLPRRAMAAPLLVHEQTLLASVASRVPLQAPVPLHLGHPGCGYPWHWSVVPWIEGEVVGVRGLLPRHAVDWARALSLLHVPGEAPANPYRGVALSRRRDAFEERLAALGEDPRIRSWRELFEEAAASTWSGPPVVLHGDLHPLNVLQRGGTPTAILDWGDLCAGDPASDLASVWMLLPLGCHDAFWSAYRWTDGPDPLLRRRARGWALSFGVVFLQSGGGDDALFTRLGELILRRVTADPSRYGPTASHPSPTPPGVP